MRQLPSGRLFQPDVELLRDGHRQRLDEGIADDGDVAALGGPLRARRLAVQEPQAVGALDGPEVEHVRPADLRVGRPQKAHAGNEDPWLANCCERHRLTDPHFPGKSNQGQPDHEQQRIPARQTQDAAELPGRGVRHAPLPLSIACQRMQPVAGRDPHHAGCALRRGRPARGGCAGHDRDPAVGRRLADGAFAIPRA